MSGSNAESPGDHAAVASLILALRRLNTTLVATNRTVSAHLGIKEGDLAVLDLLHQRGPQTPSALAKQLRIHAATMTGILTRLERDGWVKRVHDGNDRRSVSIQPVSVDRLSQAYARINEHLAGLVDGWPVGDVAAVTTFVDAVTAISEQLVTSISAEEAAGRLTP